MVHNGSVHITPTPQTPAPTPEQGAVNGRSSGRRRTPKSCDCCGPNGKGHDDKTARGETPARRGRGLLGRGRGLSGRGRGHPGRGRGHTGRGGSLEPGDLSRRKPGRPPCKNILKSAGLSEGSGEGRARDDAAAALEQKAGESPARPEEEEEEGEEEEQGRNCVPERPSEMEWQTEAGWGVEAVSGVEAEVAGSGATGAGAKRPESAAVCGSGKTDAVTEAEQQPPSAQTDGAVALSNGTAPPQPPPPPPPPPPPAPDESASPAGAPMEVEPSTLSAVPHGPILLRTALHRYAIWDHCNYCKPGTWAHDGDQAPPTQSSTTPQPVPADHSREGVREIVHEFLEHFYMKYGSFIPLSENDVLEHLNKTCNSELNSKKLNIHSEVVRYKEGLASAPMMSFMVTYNKHTLTLEDLSTLDEQNWVNDQVINMYGELIMEATQHKIHFFNSFFHRQLVAKGYEGVKRWTKKVDLFSKRLLLIPIHLEIHWSLITVDMTSQQINYYDSQGIVFKHTVDNIMRYILSEAKEKKQVVYQKGWKVIVNKGIPQQRNDSDCGVFVLEYCRCLALREPLQFSQEDMPRVRKRIYKELCDCGLSA